MTPAYSIWWRNYEESVKLFDYDVTSQVLTATAFAGERIEVVVTDAELAFVIDGDYALFMNSSGTIECAQFTKRVPGEYPRVEFCRSMFGESAAIATLSKSGRLGVREVFDGVAMPDSDDQMVFFGCVAISPNGLYAPVTREIGLLADEQDRYITTELEQLIEV